MFPAASLWRFSFIQVELEHPDLFLWSWNSLSSMEREMKLKPSSCVLCWIPCRLVLTSTWILSVIRGRMVSQAPRGKWEEREILETTGLQESVEKMDLRVSKARWVHKENPAHLVLLGRRFVATVTQAVQNAPNFPTYNYRFVLFVF